MDRLERKLACAAMTPESVQTGRVDELRRDAEQRRNGSGLAVLTAAVLVTRPRPRG